MSLRDEFSRLLNSNDNGLPDSQLKDHFGERYAGLAVIINDMLSSNRLQLFTQGGMIIYKLIREETAIKFEGLGPEQMLVFQAIEKSANRGIWTRDIKMITNIQQQILTKTLKTLEQRNLIKSVRSVASKSKKLYMLYELEPAKEVSGGPWYTDQEFDHEFLEMLSREILQFVRSQGMADINTIAEKIRISGISKVELTREELELVIQTLVYDGKLEEVRNSVLAMTGHNRSGLIMYKASKQARLKNNYTSIPCGICPVVSQCCEGGIISPSTCEYMTHWLSISPEDMENGGW